MKIIHGLILAFVLWCSPAWSAVTVGNATGNENDAVATFSFSHNNNGNYVGVCIVSSFGETVSTMTYNSVSLSQKATAANGLAVMEFWELANPTSGANTLAITLSAAGGNIRTGIVSFIGVNTASPSGTAATKVGGDGGGTSSVNVTVPANGAAMDCFNVTGADHAPVQGAGQTLQLSLGDDAAQNEQLAISTSLDAGTNAMNWTWTTDDNFNNLIAVPIHPAAANSRRVIIE